MNSALSWVALAAALACSSGERPFASNDAAAASSGGLSDGGASSGGAGGRASSDTGGAAPTGGAPSGGVGGEAAAVSGGGGAGGGGADDGGQPADDGCPDQTHLCAPQVPAGFTGPVVLDAGLPRAACPAEHPVQLLDAGRELEFEAASCSCSCELGGACGATALWRQSCGQPIAGQALGTCTELTPAQNSVDFLATLDASDATCEAEVAVVLPAATYTTNVRVCGGAPAGAPCADDGQCVARATAGYGRICVVRVGAHDCPTTYPSRVIYYTGTSDDRACSPCGCSVEEVTGCSVEVTGHAAADCSDEPLHQETITAIGELTGSCLAAGAVESVRAVPTTLGSCSVTGGEPTGTVLPDGSHTLCCLGDPE